MITLHSDLKKFRPVTGSLLLILISVLVIDCGLPFLNFGTSSIKVNIDAFRELNQNPKDPKGESHPVILEIYFLKIKENFEKAQYSDLKTKLKSDIISTIPIEVTPDTVFIQKIPRPKEALYVGFVAQYIDLPETGWREVRELKKRKFSIKLWKNQMKINE